MSFGKVKWFNSAQGYGYILHIDGREVYFHYTSIADQAKDFAVGYAVTYDLIETRQGWEAANVRRAGDFA